MSCLYIFHLNHSRYWNFKNQIYLGSVNVKAILLTFKTPYKQNVLSKIIAVKVGTAKIPFRNI